MGHHGQPGSVRLDRRRPLPELIVGVHSRRCHPQPGRDRPDPRRQRRLHHRPPPPVPRTPGTERHLHHRAGRTGRTGRVGRVGEDPPPSTDRAQPTCRPAGGHHLPLRVNDLHSALGPPPRPVKLVRRERRGVHHPGHPDPRRFAIMELVTQVVDDVVRHRLAGHPDHDQLTPEGLANRQRPQHALQHRLPSHLPRPQPPPLPPRPVLEQGIDQPATRQDPVQRPARRGPEPAPPRIGRCGQRHPLLPRPPVARHLVLAGQRHRRPPRIRHRAVASGQEPVQPAGPGHRQPPVAQHPRTGEDPTAVAAVRAPHWPPPAPTACRRRPAAPPRWRRPPRLAPARPRRKPGRPTIPRRARAPLAHRAPPPGARRFRAAAASPPTDGRHRRGPVRGPDSRPAPSPGCATRFAYPPTQAAPGWAAQPVAAASPLAGSATCP